MFMAVNLGLTSIYLARRTNRSAPIWARKSVLGGENIGERHANASR